MPGLDQPLELARALIRCPSVTPEDAGALDVLQAALQELGFTCHRVLGEAPESAPVDNLYARRGAAAPNFCFAGHSDVVPVGDRNGWREDPFAAVVRDGKLFGRGASDMKGAIAAFVAATARFLAAHAGGWNGSISLLITGDEEGPAINGTQKLLEWLEARGERLDVCLVGEPTNPERLGDMIKIGRRGSLNARLSVFGTQGHAAYPQLADNPLPRLIAMLGRLSAARLDQGSAHFQPSNIEITSIDVGNEASNVIPAKAEAAFNIRFNDSHSSASLTAWLHEQIGAVGGEYALDIHVTGEAFLTPPGEFSALISNAVEAATGRVPELSTTGGTSDARFIKDHCVVAEFGLIGRTMHQTDEHIELAALDGLAEIYENILERYFAR
ncbi:MAG: succinyl-diaminopimelate desuccinylase [Alphaproteobacteria bacterium]